MRALGDVTHVGVIVAAPVGDGANADDVAVHPACLGIVVLRPVLQQPKASIGLEVIGD